MPKSKRDKKVSLTALKRKGVQLKEKVISELQESTDQYERLFVFSCQNMRNTQLKHVRNDWKSSRFFFGKNKVMGVALGRSSADEHRDNLHKVSRRLWGQMGLLFTDKSKEDVLEYFSNYKVEDHARSGNKATETITLQEGPLESFSHALEPQLRSLGLPTSLKKGIITLTKDYTVCTKGKALTPDQARILKLFGYKMAEFAITIDSMWQKDGSFEIINEDGDQHQGNEDSGDSMEDDDD